MSNAGLMLRSNDNQELFGIPIALCGSSMTLIYAGAKQMGFSRYLDFRKLKKKNEEAVPEPSLTVGNLFLHYSGFLKKKRYMNAQ